MSNAAIKTIAARAHAEIVEKKSRFIGHISPARSEEEALAFIAEIKAEHRMARHNVYAYHIREGMRTRYTDDGEPTKTAGLPTLETIQHAGLSDVAVVVTRYFGGILLGTGGLVRAYTQATQAAISAAQIVLISICRDFEIEIPYSLYDQVLHFAQKNDARISDPEFTTLVTLRLTVLEAQQNEVKIKLKELIRDQGNIRLSEPYEAPFV